MVSYCDSDEFTAKMLGINASKYFLKINYRMINTLYYNNQRCAIQGNCIAPNWLRVPYPLPGLNDFRIDAVTNSFA